MARSSRLASPVEIERYLHGIDYPAERDELIEIAQDNDAPDEIIQTLEQLPDRMYNSPTDVSKGIGQIM